MALIFHKLDETRYEQTVVTKLFLKIIIIGERGSGSFKSPEEFRVTDDDKLSPSSGDGDVQSSFVTS